MCDKREMKKSKDGSKFSINFNQDFSSLAVVSDSGYKLFSIQTINKVDEIYASDDFVDTKIAERLFSSSLVAVVTRAEQNKLKVCHFKKGSEICNYSYPKNILAVKLNRSRLIVCLKDSLYIHNIRDMRLLHSIKDLPENEHGLVALSLNSIVAYPISKENGNVQIFDAGNLQKKLIVEAHDSVLSALSFSSNGLLLATASTKGTVIRVFCVKNGQRVVEFRRGVKRYAQIVSLNFSICSNYVSVSSNTETIHIFKIDPKAKESAERRQEKLVSENGDEVSTTPSDRSGFLNAFSKAVNSIIPVSNVLSQDRAFAFVQLSEPGLKYQCVVTKLEKETRLLVACEDGFLYIYNLDDSNGGECKLIRAHDLRSALYDITELEFGSERGSERGSECGSMTGSLKISTKENIIPEIAKSSYAEVMQRGIDKNEIKDESDKMLRTVPVDQSKRILDENQFPPVQSVCQ